ncbi:hypothetical protein D7X96_25100 [Corallococcus interemptor]|uniref:Lipoprotein n=1 Tax=Corallococcus interemptor TaxID=2316720 RepID=A0A3A8QB43_9BACT|nr:hypothetical protein [Corallococcus interemptor]RKH50636.1 hypothetical protein D7Y23_12755 [Corallococcus sp. AB050B]RKH64801.1 hypothetical protein D7X96_25100 [Corallococcus interemptor]
MKRAVLLGMCCALFGACGEEGAVGMDAGVEDAGWPMGSVELNISMGEDPCPVATATVTMNAGDPSRPVPSIGPLPLNVRDGVIQGTTFIDVYASQAWWVQVHAYDSNGVNVCWGQDPFMTVYEGRVTRVDIEVGCLWPHCP